MDGGQVEKETKSRGTRGEVEVNWDVNQVVIREGVQRGYESKDGRGERYGAEGIEDVRNVEADGLECRGYSLLGFMEVLVGWWWGRVD